MIDQKQESISIDMPLGVAIHNIEITLGKGGQLARAAGAVAKLIAKQGKSATLKLPSREVRLISKNCSATVGQVGNVGVRVKEEKYKKKTMENERDKRKDREREEEKKEEEKNDRFSISDFEWSLSFEEDFLKF